MEGILEPIMSNHYSTVYSKQYEWILKNVSLYSFNTRCSPEFVMGTYRFYVIGVLYQGALTWTIKLVFGKDEPMKIYLILNDFNEFYKSISIKCAFQIIHGSTTNNSILEFDFSKSKLTAGPLNGITIKQKDLKNSDFKIAVSLIENDSGNKFIETKHKELNFTIPIPELDVTNDFKKLMSNEELSDLVLESKTRKFKVHKTILASRSSYFMTALKNDMKEKHENIIHMSEEDNVIEELLNYIYTGKFQNTGISKDLFIAADKYQLDGLKKICIYELFKTVTIENAIEWLLFADQYNSKEFKNYLMKFIIFHINEISKTDDFNSLSEKNSELFEFFNCLI